MYTQQTRQRIITYPGPLTTIVLECDQEDCHVESVHSSILGSDPDAAEYLRQRYAGLIIFINAIADAGMSEVLVDPRFEDVLMYVALAQGQNSE